MYIKELTIRNFRNFSSAKFKFNKNLVNTIIGENASGKTNLFYAMRLILDESLPNNVRQLQEKDFCRVLKKPFGHWIIISLRFGDLGFDDEDLVLANQVIETSNLAMQEGTYTFIYRPKKNVRTKFHEITIDSTDLAQKEIAFNDYISKQVISRDTYEIVAFTRSEVDFSNEADYQEIVGDFDNFIFPDPQIEDSTKIGNYKPPYFSIVKEVSCTFVKALRNVVADMKYSNSNPLFKLLEYQSKEIVGAENIISKVKDLNSSISNLDNIKDLSRNIRETLVQAVGHTYSPAIDVTSDLPEEMGDLIQSLCLIVEDSSNYNGSGKLEDMSLGGANLIYLALKLFEHEVAQKKDDKIAHFLMIEEPEAHIHNHVQKTLFTNFNESKTQVFVSTHSSQISSVAKASSINIVSRKKGFSEVYWPTYKLDPLEIPRIERYLDAVRTTLLFAKGVILVEGDAEKILIPSLVKNVLGISLDELGISLVSMDSTVFTHISNLFHADRIRNHCSIITDLDEAIVEELTTYTDEDYVKHAKASAKKGIERQNILNEHVQDNHYLKVFYAKHTFEVDLINAKNSDLYCSILEKVYTQDATIKRWKTGLTSIDTPVRSYYGLKLAEIVGKGWFAILLAEKIEVNTTIPNYILKALAHSLKGHINDACWLKMMTHRISAYDESQKTLFETEWRSKNENSINFKTQDFWNFFVTDPLTLMAKEMHSCT